MRMLALPVLFLAACGAEGGAQTAAGTVALVCPQTPAPAVLQLCDALTLALREQGYGLDQTGGASLRLVLNADSPRASVLNARLTVEQDGARTPGEDMQLMVVDRDTIPGRQIEDFARSLLRRAALPDPVSQP